MKDTLTLLLIFAVSLFATSDNVGFVLALLIGCGALQYDKIIKYITK